MALGRASILLASGQVDQARTMLREVGRHIPPGLAVRRDVMLADTETALGRPQAALRLLHGYEASDFATLAAMPRARAHLALNDLRSAQDCVRNVLATPSPQTGRLTVVEALLCGARIAQLDEDPGRTLEMLIWAIEIARDEIVLPFAQTRDTFACLLARHPAVAARWPAPGPDPQPEPEPDGQLAPPAQAGLPDPLTPRELAVLRFLATGMSTTEIASELCLSANTVKTHLAAIYRKLAAGRRRDAVLRARELELI
jgi:LuxR family maltose regulon positive regulatory protein